MRWVVLVLLLPATGAQMIPMMTLDFGQCQPCPIMGHNQTLELHGVFTWIEHGSNGDAWVPPEEDIRVDLTQPGIPDWLVASFDPAYLIVPRDAHLDPARYSVDEADIVFTWTAPVTMFVTRHGDPPDIGYVADRDGVVQVFGKLESQETALYRNAFGLGDVRFDAYEDDKILAAAVKHLETSEQANATEKLDDLGFRFQSVPQNGAEDEGEVRRAMPWWPIVLLFGASTAGAIAWIGRRQ